MNMLTVKMFLELISAAVLKGSLGMARTVKVIVLCDSILIGLFLPSSYGMYNCEIMNN